MGKRFAILIGAVFAASSLFVASASALPGTVIYNNIPSPVPGNAPSQAFEATSTSEVGSQVQFAGTDRFNPVVTVMMSSWGCQNGSWNVGNCSTSSGATFTQPVTLTFYSVNADNSVGSVIATQTHTFAIPYRPSADNTNCTGDSAGKWFSATDATCYSGLNTPITFDFTGQNVTLPNNVIVGVSYNTTHFGSSPYGDTASCYGTPAGCGYDSLNVSTNPDPSVGASLPSANDAYISSTWSGAYCDGGLGTGSFRLDAGCWTGYLPAIKVAASTMTAAQPTKAKDCKNNGWKNFTAPVFASQKACEKWVSASAEGSFKLTGGNQKIKFNVANTTNGNNWEHHDRDEHGNRGRQNTVEYWDFTYPDGAGTLHYKANVSCTNVNPLTKDARFVFQIPAGHGSLSGLYIVAYTKEVAGHHTPDLFGFAVAPDQNTAKQWCDTGVGFSPSFFPPTTGKVEIED